VAKMLIAESALPSTSRSRPPSRRPRCAGRQAADGKIGDAAL
jgi:hypothetical protein